MNEWKRRKDPVIMAVRATEDPLDRYLMSDEEWRRRFDLSCQHLLGISGDEFVARWDAGEYGDVDEHPQGSEAFQLSLLIPREYQEDKNLERMRN